MIKTRLCNLLNIKYPIIQGGMAWISTAELVSAVAEAGGIGMIAAGNMAPEHLREEIQKAKKMTDKSFGVNLMLMAPQIEDLVQIVIDEKVPVITTGAGNPGKYMEDLKGADIRVLPVVASVALAKRMEKYGADAVIIEGMEAGGHIGEVSTMVLLPQVVDAVSIPVIGAGGIGDGRAMAAAFALGADGVQIGTRFINTEECIAHRNYKNMILKANDRDTCVTGRITGHPVRVLKNQFARLLLKFEQEGIDPKALEMLGVGKLRAAAREGDVMNGSVMIGQVAGMINEISTVKEVIDTLIKDTEKILNRLPKQYIS